MRHAVKIHRQVDEASIFFNHHFAAQRGLFPRGPQHWNGVLNEALDGFLEHTGEPIAMELADALRTNLQAENRSFGKASIPIPARQEEWGELKKDILGPDHRPETLARRLFELLERNHDYAMATGVSCFFVRTLHNLGTALLERHVLGSADMSRFGIMIERALIWEPANPYCWMLWAEWFKVQNRRDAHEATLREMLRLFPSDLHARVELALLLISRGNACWDEAEHHLRNAMDQDPNGSHSCVVMARLLVLRRRSTEAKAMLAKFLERHPDNAAVQESLDRLQDRSYPETAAAAFGDAWNDEIQERAAHQDSPISLPGALQELLRRGHLAGEFSRARIAMARGLDAPTDLIRRESLKGDPLAGFYSQWLMPEETPESPPHAWAWKACRYWQASASPDDWRHLATHFPEAAPETEFLRALATPGGGGDPIGYGNNGAGRAVDAFMREAQERLVGASPRERDELAGAVMACAAVDARDVLWESAD